MEIKRAAELLRGLADGVDPMTGRPLPDESVYNRPEIIRRCTASCGRCRSAPTARPPQTRAEAGARRRKRGCCRNTVRGSRPRQSRAAMGGASAPSKRACPSSASVTRSSSACDRSRYGTNQTGAFIRSGAAAERRAGPHSVRQSRDALCAQRADHRRRFRRAGALPAEPSIRRVRFACTGRPTRPVRGGQRRQGQIRPALYRRRGQRLPCAAAGGRIFQKAGR